MEQLLQTLLEYALDQMASDIHFILKENHLKITFRTPNGFQELLQDIWNPDFFEYLKYKSHFDLTNPYLPQSGQFNIQIQKTISCRFSVIVNQSIQTGVLRILNNNMFFTINELCHDNKTIEFFYSLVHRRNGLIIMSGPTGCGKTTTLHAILHEIGLLKQNKVVSLEDPIEIKDDTYLQLQINENQGFTYEKGIEELLRHDPDVIFIGETRNAYSAKMVLRASLTGHFVFTTLHAKNSLETIERLLDFGLPLSQLKQVLTAIISSRIYQSRQGRECIYEILSKEDLQYALQNRKYPSHFQTLSKKIQKQIESGNIIDTQAKYDLLDL
ncbi:ATPase, T2SS/T4P/T4SS family [Floccifex sp.]|uniref:ATPase, T2SS/T4P/T4SS family n=1 Tax=Floccifex sp. TaxID=2815810 RepID=UPI003F0459F5